MHDLQRRDRLHASSPQFCQIRHGHPPFSLSLPKYQHVCSTTPYTPPKQIPIQKHMRIHINTQTQRRPSLLHLYTNPAWPLYHNKKAVLGIRTAIFSQQPLSLLSRSNDTALCPVTHITLAGCHKENTLSRLMAGLHFTENISHIFTVKTMWNMRSKFKVKFNHFS